MRLGMGLGLGNLLSGQPLTGFPNDFSFNFDGSNDYLKIEDNSGLAFVDGQAFSASIWFKTSSSSEQYLFDNRSSNEGFTALVNASGTNYLGYITDGSSNATFTSTVDYDDGAWHNFAFTWDGTDTIKSYIDGSLVGTGTQALGEIDGGDLYIGSQAGGSTKFFNGQLDEFAVWNAELSSDDVAKIASKPVDFSKASTYATDRTSNLKLWLRAGDKALPEEDASIARQDFYTDFDGTDDYVEVADSDDLSFGDSSSDTPFSISAWINPVDATSFNIVSKGKYNVDGEYLFEIDGNDDLYFSFSDDAGFEGAYTNTALTSYEGSWLHVCGTYDGRGGTDARNGIKLYINGVEQAKSVIGGNSYVAMHNKTGEVEIGKYDTNYAEGKISNVAIYKTTLDAQTIKQFAKSRFTPMRDNRFSVVDFDGSNDYIDTGTGLGTSLGDGYTGDLSFSIWANLTDVSATNDALVHIGDFSNNHGVITIVSLSNNIIFRLNGTAWSVTETLTSGWHHIMAVWDSSDYTKTKLYVDGVTTHADNSSSFPSSLNFDGMKTIIGAFYSSSFTYDGSISSVAIYNVAKSAEEVYAIYQQGITYDESSLSGLVGY
jgi:hypothetical protein